MKDRTGLVKIADVSKESHMVDPSRPPRNLWLKASFFVYFYDTKREIALCQMFLKALQL